VTKESPIKRSNKLAPPGMLLILNVKALHCKCDGSNSCTRLNYSILSYCGPKNWFPIKSAFQ
jgi:hypothetical protein